MQVWIESFFVSCNPADPLLYGSLAVISFVAATLFPLSSEIALSAGLACGMLPAPAILSASLGNCLGCAFNFWLGWRGGRRLLLRLARKRSGRRALSLIRKFGLAALLFSWLPVVGDPLTVLAGCLRLPIFWSNLVVFTTRIVRYVLLAGLLDLSFWLWA